MLSLLAKLGAAVLFNKIARVDVNTTMVELFNSNIGGDRAVKLVKVKP